MFFFFPVGSEEGVRRLPYVTIGLIALNTIIYLITSMAISRQIDRLMDLDRQLRDIEIRYTYRLLEKDPSTLTKYTDEQLREQILDGDIIPVGSTDYDTWVRLYNDFQTERGNIVYEKYGFVPKRFDIIKVITSMFIHAGFLHLLFNMLYLWLVGCNIEDDWSWPIFLGLYLISGFFAVLLHTIMSPQSTIPLVGASGAIAGIMGAFMVRHFRTKVRFAYFIWLIFTRPYMGTFAVYAGIALPLWFLIELACAPGSGDGGTAHWAHIGGFIFGALVGVAMKYLHLEKKYVAPMVEDSFEKLKMTFSMREAARKMDEGDIDGAIPLLLAAIAEEPDNIDARLILARIHAERGDKEKAAELYNAVLERLIAGGDPDLLKACLEEIKEKGLIECLSEKNAYQSGVAFERAEKYAEAAQCYGTYIALFPGGGVRAKALFRTYLLFKNKLQQPAMAEQVRSCLKKEYPDHPLPS